jgi:hypothetical protein
MLWCAQLAFSTPGDCIACECGWWISCLPWRSWQLNSRFVNPGVNTSYESSPPDRSGWGSTQSFGHRTSNEAAGRSAQYQNTDSGGTISDSRSSYGQPASREIKIPSLQRCFLKMSAYTDSRSSISIQTPHPADQPSLHLPQSNNKDPSGYRSSLTNEHGIKLRPVSDLRMFILGS